MKKLFPLFSVLALGCSSGDDANEQFVEAPIATYTLDLDFSNEFQIGQNIGLNYFNDITVGVIDYSTNNIRLLTASGNSSYVLEGPGLNNITNATRVAAPTLNTFYPNYVGLGQLIKDKQGVIYSAFHAEEHDGTILPGGIPGFYASIGLGISNDNGQSFSLLDEPLVDNIYDITYDNGYGDGGLGEPSITFSKDSTEIFLYYVDHNRSGRGVNISMSKFNVNSNGTPDFDNCYYLGDDNSFTSTIIRSKEVVKGTGQSDAIFPQVTYNKLTDTYLMVYSENNWGEFVNGSTNPSSSGIYYRQSEDGINWTSPAVQLIQGWSIPYSYDEHSFMWHPNLIYTNDSQSEGYLVYSKANTLSEGHKMWAIKFNLTQN